MAPFFYTLNILITFAKHKQRNTNKNVKKSIFKKTIRVYSHTMGITGWLYSKIRHNRWNDHPNDTNVGRNCIYPNLQKSKEIIILATY